jgi:predicted nucleic acid-binding protein
MAVNKTLFLDTNYFCGLHNPKDSLYLKSRKAFIKIKKEKYILHISNFILAEVFTILSQKVGKRIAIQFGRNLFSSYSPINIIRMTGKDELSSFNIFQKVKSKNFSFVDANSLALMKKFKINYLLTFDNQLIQEAKKYNIKSLGY